MRSSAGTRGQRAELKNGPWIYCPLHCSPAPTVDGAGAPSIERGGGCGANAFADQRFAVARGIAGRRRRCCRSALRAPLRRAAGARAPAASALA